MATENKMMPVRRPMARGVATDRELTNVKTGIDLSVPSFKIEVQNSKYLSGHHVTFNLIVVTNVPEIVTAVKNTATGKTFETGCVIHFAQHHTYDEFWKLRKDLDKKFCGTLVPDIPKKLGRADSFAFTKSNIRMEAKCRQTSVDNLLKWCASVPKIASSEILMKFFGCQSVKDPTETNEQDDDAITKDTIKKVFKPHKDDIEVENEMFRNDSLSTSTESDLFGEIDDSSIDQGSLHVHVNDVESTKDEIIPEKSFAKLFETISEVSMEDAKDNSSLSEKLVMHEEILEYGQNQLVEVDDSVSDVLSQMQQFSFTKLSRKINKRQESGEPSKVESGVDVNELEDEDLIRYINNQESDDDVDLGF